MVLPRAVAPLLQDLPLNRLRSLGGKLGEEARLSPKHSSLEDLLSCCFEDSLSYAFPTVGVSAKAAVSVEA